MNLWLDSQFPAYPDDFRQIQLAAYAGFGDEPNRHLRERRRKRAFAASILAARDLVHDHAALAGLVPAGTFRMTVLRRPVDRLLSQLADFRRLKPHDYAHHPPEVRQVHADIHDMEIGPYLEKHALSAGPFRHFFDNYMVRAIAHNRLGALCNDLPDAGALLPAAIETLARDFDLVGVLEREFALRQRLARAFGWAPPTGWPVLNRGRPDEALQRQQDDARDILEHLTAADMRLYRTACELSGTNPDAAPDAARDATPDTAADTTAFERHHARRTLGRLRARPSDLGMLYDMGQPIVGSGHRGRRCNGEGRCWCWSDAGQALTLYIPVPAGIPVTVFLRVLEYGDEGYRDRLAVSVDGTPVGHELARAPRCRDLLRLACRPRRDFLRLELRIGADETGRPARGNGLRIDAYGWDTPRPG